MSNEVGEADGGWWFVCGHCDHLWNERERLMNDRSAIHADVRRSTSQARTDEDSYRHLLRHAHGERAVQGTR
jgi:hypothetical protein